MTAPTTNKNARARLLLGGLGAGLDLLKDFFGRLSFEMLRAVLTILVIYFATLVFQLVAFPADAGPALLALFTAAGITDHRLGFTALFVAVLTLTYMVVFVAYAVLSAQDQEDEEEDPQNTDPEQRTQ